MYSTLSLEKGDDYNCGIWGAPWTTGWIAWKCNVDTDGNQIT